MSDLPFGEEPADLRTMYNEVSSLTDEMFRSSRELTMNAMLLTLTAHYAWTDTWARGLRQTQAAISEHQGQQERTRRLIRRGVPAEIAARGLRVV